MKNSVDLSAQFDRLQRRERMPRVSVLIVLGMAALVLSACLYNRIGFQGKLLDASGNPVTGNYNFKFDYWTCSSGTGSGCTKVYSYTSNNVPVKNGLFDTPIGPEATAPAKGPDPALFARPLWVEITVNGETLSPRQPLQGSPYAMSLVGGAIVLGLQQGPGGTDGTDENYGSLTVVAGGAKGTALVINANTNGGDLIRGCTGALGGTNQRTCSDLRFRVTNDGNVSADGVYKANGADFAEYIAGVGDRSHYAPGDVLVISATQDRAVELASKPYSTAVIGVYSTKPGMIGGGYLLDASGATDKIPVAIVGIVPVKVSAENGSIHRGDLLTTSTTPGYAMLATEYRPGAIVGKAMGELKTGKGTIEVALLVK